MPEWVSPLLPSAFDGETVKVFAMRRQTPAGAVRLLGQRSGDGESPDLIEIGAMTLPGRLETADTLSRMAASARFHSVTDHETTQPPTNATRLAVDYQLVTGKTNFLLVHERSDSEKAIDMPELQKIQQMVPAGWGGWGSVSFSRSSTVLASRVGDKVSCSATKKRRTTKSKYALLATHGIRTLIDESFTFWK